MVAAGDYAKSEAQPEQLQLSGTFGKHEEEEEQLPPGCSPHTAASQQAGAEHAGAEHAGAGRMGPKFLYERVSCGHLHARWTFCSIPALKGGDALAE